MPGGVISTTANKGQNVARDKGKGMGLTHEVENPVRSGAQRSAFRPHAE